MDGDGSEEEMWTEETEHLPVCTCGCLDLEIVQSTTTRRFLERNKESLNDRDRIVVIDVQDEFFPDQGWDAVCQGCGKVLE